MSSTTFPNRSISTQVVPSYASVLYIKARGRGMKTIYHP